MEYSQRLNELKSLILAKCGIRFMTPADCKRISIEISKHLNKNVSETTIKRLFGFAVVKHKFSTFTLTTLAEYVDMAEVIAIPAEAPHVQHNDNWSSVRTNAQKITNFTLKTIRNRSGVPYEMTVGRKFAEHDFVEFYNSDYIFTCFISQPGYGKTILLSHLAEELFYKQNAIYSQSTLFFIKAYSFFNAETINVNLEDQLKVQLKIDPKENTLDYINRAQAAQGGKFIIIIDAFGELMLKKDEKGLLYDNIVNFICSLEDYKNIKLVLSMRSTAWTRFYNRVRHSSYMKSKWFSGNYFNLNDLSNVPPLSEKEVDTIISRINSTGKYREIGPKLKAQLKFPFHIQLYYQLKEEDPDFNYYTNITFYELVSRFIQEKIYRSNYYTEKILFLKKVIQLTEYGKKTNSVEKDTLLTELSAFRNAYMELIADGILMEEKQTVSAHPKEYVRFLHTHTFEYFLFVEILEKFHLQTNMEFFDYINTEYESNQVRFQLLQWSTRFLIKTGNFKSLPHIFQLKLNSFETNYLIMFMAEEIKYRSKYNTDLIRLLEEDNFHDEIIGKLINFDFIDSCYKEAVMALIVIARKDEHLLIYNSILAILAIIRMDKEDIKEILKELKRLDDSKWMIKPAEAVEIIYAKLNNENPANEMLVHRIEELKKGHIPFENKPDHPMCATEGISYLLLLFINLFTGDVRRGTEIIANMVELHPKEFIKRSTFNTYILTVFGMYSSKVAPGIKTEQIDSIIQHLSGHNDKNFTNYHEALLMMFQAQQAYNRKEYEVAIENARECLLLFKRNDIVLNSMFMFNLLINIFTDLNNYDMVNEYKYEKLCLLDDQNIPKNLF